MVRERGGIRMLREGGGDKNGEGRTEKGGGEIRMVREGGG